MSPELSLRFATEKDIPLLLAFIRDLAEYERLPQEVTATDEQLKHTLFGPKPYAEAVFAFWEQEPVGFALFFHNYSTFLAKPGLYLEDLFVKPAFRSRGIGKAMMHFLADVARERGCGRFEWWVLDWNEPSIEFYKKLGAVPMSEWTVMRIAGEALEKLGA